jgi:Topoisomerase DNA binding C4 zinc finger
VFARLLSLALVVACCAGDALARGRDPGKNGTGIFFLVLFGLIAAVTIGLLHDAIKRLGFNHFLDDSGDRGLLKRLSRRLLFGAAASIAIAATGLLGSDWSRAATLGVIWAAIGTAGSMLHALLVRNSGFGSATRQTPSRVISEHTKIVEKEAPPLETVHENNAAHDKKKPGSEICPRCNGRMVRRTARRGANSGQEFWGCSRYPICRGLRPC